MEIPFLVTSCKPLDQSQWLRCYISNLLGMFTNKSLPMIFFLIGAQWQVSMPGLCRSLAAICRKHLVLCDLLIELSRYKARLMHRPHWAHLIMFCLAKKRIHTSHIGKGQSYLVRIRVSFLQPLLVLNKSVKNLVPMPLQGINPSLDIGTASTVSERLRL